MTHYILNYKRHYILYFLLACPINQSINLIIHKIWHYSYITLILHPTLHYHYISITLALHFVFSWRQRFYRISFQANGISFLFNHQHIIHKKIYRRYTVMKKWHQAKNEKIQVDSYNSENVRTKNFGSRWSSRINHQNRLLKKLDHDEYEKREALEKEERKFCRAIIRRGNEYILCGKKQCEQHLHNCKAILRGGKRKGEVCNELSNQITLKT